MNKDLMNPMEEKITSEKLGDILLRHGVAKKDDISAALKIQEKIRSGISGGERSRGMKLGEILVKNGVITPSNLNAALEEQRRAGGSIGKQLARLGFIKESDLVTFLSKEFGAATVNLLELEIPENVLKLVPPDLAVKLQVIPFKRQGNTLYLAVSDPTRVETLDDIKFLTGLNVEIVVASENEISSALTKYYNASSILTENKDYLNSIAIEEPTEELNISELQKSSSEQPIIKFVNKVLLEAVRSGASDIHIEPYESIVRVRYRMDGKLIEQMQIPAQLKNPIISRLKIMSQLDIAERRLPQDGRIKAKMEGRDVDMRVSCLPTLFGEKIVIRILDKSNLQLDMTKLGFSVRQLEAFKYAIHRPFGMILVTGPTGSGKTTTLYSALSEVNKPDVNISTAEDPVEYNIEGINQVLVNEEIGLTFAMALRSFLRQDPDIIMVGEIRDMETAEIAIKAALTGHLVLSTIHTNNASATISRLINMKVEPFLVASSLNLVIAQRLVRKLCMECKEKFSPNEDELIRLGFDREKVSKGSFYKAKGCPVCNKTGYKGRIAIYEVLNVDENIKGRIYENATEFEIQAAAAKNGMQTLGDSARGKFLDGVTSIEEIMQYLDGDIDNI